MEDLQITEDQPPKLVNQLIINTQVEYDYNSCGQHHKIVETHDNGIERRILLGGHYSETTIYFKETLHENDLIEYRRWYDTGKKEFHYFAKKLSDGKIVKDGSYMKWSCCGRLQESSYYKDGDLLTSSKDNIYCGNVQVYYDEFYTETLKKNANGKFYYTREWNFENV